MECQNWQTGRAAAPLPVKGGCLDADYTGDRPRMGTLTVGTHSSGRFAPKPGPNASDVHLPDVLAGLS